MGRSVNNSKIVDGEVPVNRLCGFPLRIKAKQPDHLGEEESVRPSGMKRTSHGTPKSNNRTIQTRLAEPSVKYSYGSYNKKNKTEQWIRITEGCPHNCPWCYEPIEYKTFEIPKIERNIVKIMDMNLLAKSNAIEIIRKLPSKLNGKNILYELICGADYRFINSEIANELAKKHIPKIRIAWDNEINQQYDIKNKIEILRKACFKQIMVFMICNHYRCTFKDNMRKLDLLKVWGVQVADCYFDNQTFPNVQPLYWTYVECKEFRKQCRKHNQIINFGVDPEWKM